MKLKLFTLSAVIAVAVASFAQGPSKDADGEAQKAAEKKIAVLLDALMSDIPALRLPENRARTLADTARLLWPRDAQRARKLFAAAIKELVALNNQSGDDYKSGGDFEPQQNAAYWQRRQLRSEVLGLIAQHDAGLALKGLVETRPAASAAEGEAPEQEQRTALQLAVQIALKDPRRALATAEEVLDRGALFGEVGSVMSELWSSDREAAIELAGKIAAKLRAETFSTNHEALGVAINLLNLAAVQDSPSTQQGKALPTLPAKTLREVIEQMYAAALNDNSSRNEIDGPVSVPLFQQLQAAMATVERYAPETAAAIKKATPQVRQFSDPYSLAWNNLNQLSEKKSVEALLEAAPQASAQMRNEYYQRAANLALEQGAPERAREIISRNITDPVQRTHALANVERQMVWRAVQQSNIEEARALALRLPTLQERVQQFSQLAERALSNKDREQARVILDEARAMLGSQVTRRSRLWAQLLLAAQYAKVAPEIGFELIEPAVNQLDELIAASALVEEFTPSGGFRDGEMLVRGGSTMNNLLQQYGHALAALAASDFARTDVLAARFQRAEARVVMRLALIQNFSQPQGENFLTAPPPPPARFRK